MGAVSQPGQPVRPSVRPSVCVCSDLYLTWRRPSSAVDVDGHRARSGIIAYDKDGLIVMVSAPREDKETKTVTLDWIFPRGGIDTRMDGWDPSKPEPHFRAAAIREADEEAGVLFPGDFKPDDLRLLTHTENGAEYWFSGPVGSLKDSWKEEGPNKHRGHFTVDEAENMLRSAKKFQKTMLKALREYRDGASSSGSGGH